VGAELLRRAIRVAREEGITALSAEMLPDNLAMQVITKALGFKVKMQPGFASMSARLELV
jgi:RimJ/RimL family protein N-acetyltransferase